MEQKNFNLIRQAVGYARFDSPQEVSLLGQLYAQLRLLVNHFRLARSKYSPANG